MRFRGDGFFLFYIFPEERRCQPRSPATSCGGRHAFRHDFYRKYLKTNNRIYTDIFSSFFPPRLSDTNNILFSKTRAADVLFLFCGIQCRRSCRNWRQNCRKRCTLRPSLLLYGAKQQDASKITRFHRVLPVTEFMGYRRVLMPIRMKKSILCL